MVGDAGSVGWCVDYSVGATASRQRNSPASYSYDANGNQTAGGGLSSLAYNAANQTTSVTPSGDSAVSLTYAGNGQEALRTIGNITLNDSLLGVTRTAPTGSGGTYYIRDNHGALLEECTPNSRYYYITDGLGSIVDLTDGSGQVVATYHYDPYGNLTTTTGSITNPFRYASRYYDTQTGLYHIGARYYNPAEGRWTQQDPTSHIGDLQQQNAYPYAGDDPVDNTDPSGRSLGCDIGGIVVGGLVTWFSSSFSTPFGAWYWGAAAGGSFTEGCNAGASASTPQLYSGYPTITGAA